MVLRRTTTRESGLGSEIFITTNNKSSRGRHLTGVNSSHDYIEDVLENLVSTAHRCGDPRNDWSMKLCEQRPAGQGSRTCSLGCQKMQSAVLQPPLVFTTNCLKTWCRLRARCVSASRNGMFCPRQLFVQRAAPPRKPKGKHCSRWRGNTTALTAWHKGPPALPCPALLWTRGRVAFMQSVEMPRTEQCPSTANLRIPCKGSHGCHE